MTGQTAWGPMRENAGEACREENEFVELIERLELSAGIVHAAP